MFGQGQRERARAVQVFPGPVPEIARTGRPGGVPAEAPVQRVRQPHQIETRRSRGRGHGHGFRPGGRRRRGHRRTRPATAGTAETAEPESDQTVQPEDQATDPGLHRWRGWWGRGRLQRQLNAR